MVSSRHFPALKGVVVAVPLSRGPLEASSTMAAPIKNRRKKSGPAVRPTLITLSVKCLLIPRNLGKRESKVLFFHLLLLLLSPLHDGALARLISAPDLIRIPPRSRAGAVRPLSWRQKGKESI